MLDRFENTELAKGQLGFIDFVAKDHYALMAQWNPEFKKLHDRLLANREKWASIQDKNVKSQPPATCT